MKTLATTEISVLDLAKISEDKTIADTFHHSRDLARLVEKLGYKRFWLAEHHNISSIASAATSVLIGYIAENTKSIRVGSGGIMLPNHAPLVIAEQFGTLASLYPGRIDLGLGRAPGSDQQTMRAIRRNTQEEDFGNLIEELLYYFAPAGPGQKIKAIPGAGIEIPIYILGSSLYSAQLAARLGRPYAFAGHFAPAAMMEAFELYRHQFKPSAYLQKPYVMVGVPVIAAETDEKAAFLATSVQQAFLGLIRGDRRPTTKPVQNIDFLWTEREKAFVESMLGLLVTGSPEKVRKDLDKLIQATGADELIITSDTYDPEDRLKSFEYIAKAKTLFA
jgi:luciferase family oxidoreductase group 1